MHQNPHGTDNARTALKPPKKHGTAGWRFIGWVSTGGLLSTLIWNYNSVLNFLSTIASLGSIRPANWWGMHEGQCREEWKQGLSLIASFLTSGTSPCKARAFQFSWDFLLGAGLLLWYRSKFMPEIKVLIVTYYELKRFLRPVLEYLEDMQWPSGLLLKGHPRPLLTWSIASFKV